MIAVLYKIFKVFNDKEFFKLVNFIASNLSYPNIFMVLLTRVPGLPPELWRTNEKVPFSFKYDFRKLNGSSRRNNCAQITRDICR